MKLELIKKRKSVRTYDNKGLSKQELDSIQNIIDNLDNPFDVNIRFTILEKDKYHLESPVLTGEKYYICAVASKEDDYRLGLGYMFEDLVLKLEEMGLSTVIIAGTYKKDNFIKAFELDEDKELALITPVGHKAEKMALRETLMRKGVRADSRIDSDKLFFMNDFNNPVVNNEKYHEALEAVRWSPSAVNKQPWRVLIKDDAIHFYKCENKGYELMQEIDMGIALRNFTYVYDREYRFVSSKPDIDTDFKYVISIV